MEVLVALALLAIALVATTALYMGHHGAQLLAGQQMAAQGYLLENMERLRAMAPLQEGRTVWNLEERHGPLPPGIPMEGGRLVLETEPWRGARPPERVQRVVLTLHWLHQGRRRSAGLETLMPGPPEEEP